MARVTGDGQTRASTTSLLMSRTSHLRDLCQTGCDVMSVLVSQEADVLLANLAYGHDRALSPRQESPDATAQWLLFRPLVPSLTVALSLHRAALQLPGFCLLE